MHVFHQREKKYTPYVNINYKTFFVYLYMHYFQDIKKLFLNLLEVKYHFSILKMI